MRQQVPVQIVLKYEQAR